MKTKKKIIFAAFIFFSATTVLFADEVKDETLALFKNSFDMLWLVIAAALVFFMQAGFAMVEIGLTRAKNSGNIIMKNLMDFSVGAVAYFAIGWVLMYGKSAGGFVGIDNFLFSSTDSSIMRDWIFQVVFAATAATIVSGAMAERTKFTSYLIYSLILSAVIYPISGHWIWNASGWLSNIGFIDFAGSTVVHSVGGWAALAGAIMLGPRMGKYIEVDGKKVSKAIPGHNMPLAALGIFILWFGWYGFNCGSTLSGTDLGIAQVAVTTTLSASSGAIASMVTSWFKFGKSDPSMSLNGALAGLVAITAGCAIIKPIDALIIGFLAGILVVLSVDFIDKRLHIDDPVGAISVHGVCGLWGSLAVGLFAEPENGLCKAGLFYGGQQFGIQLIGVLSVFAWVFTLAMGMFYLIKKTVGLRVAPKEESEGLDISEHRMDSYSGFQIFSNM